MHDVATFGDARIVARLARDRDRVTRKARVDRAAASADVLTQAAPAHASDDRGDVNLIAHRLA